MKHAILQFIRDEQGATAIEYGLLAGLIAAAIITAVTGVGTSLNTIFNYIAGAIPKT